MDQYTNTNKDLWNTKVPYHLKSELYNLEAFLAGENVLREPELAELGDVSGLSILHLQCHFGQDTLCLARMGATCTGVDFSDTALVEARRLNKELGLAAKFVEADVLKLKEKLTGQFDRVFTSYGALIWLPDLKIWADIVNHFLKPGGELVIAEFHPAIYMLNWETLNIEYNYFNPGEPDHEEVHGTYADPSADIHMEEYTWTHSFEEIIMPLLGQGLILESFREYNYTPYDCFPDLKKIGKYKWQFNKIDKEVPYMFSMRFRKPI